MYIVSTIWTIREVVESYPKSLVSHFNTRISPSFPFFPVLSPSSPSFPLINHLLPSLALFSLFTIPLLSSLCLIPHYPLFLHYPSTLSLHLLHFNYPFSTLPAPLNHHPPLPLISLITPSLLFHYTSTPPPSLFLSPVYFVALFMSLFSHVQPPVQ